MELSCPIAAFWVIPYIQRSTLKTLSKGPNLDEEDSDEYGPKDPTDDDQPKRDLTNYPISNPNYPEELSIPLITVNLMEDPLLTNSGNTNTFKETWQIHLLTERPTWMYCPTFGLTPILECDNFAGNITIPRNSLDKVIVIPSATTCENCKATCRLIQCIKLECAESQALEEYTLLVLDAQDPFLSVDPLINAD